MDLTDDGSGESLFFGALNNLYTKNKQTFTADESDMKYLSSSFCSAYLVL